MPPVSVLRAGFRHEMTIRTKSIPGVFHPVMKHTHDLIVIGGGRASNLAIAAAKEGWKVALIERDRLGGACPNRGCVPSKLLIGFAEAARHVRDAARHFIDAELRGIDAGRIFASVNEYVSGVDGRYAKRLADAGVELIRGEGRFTGQRQVGVGDEVFSAPKIVVATGSRPAPAPHADLGVWTSDSLFPLHEDPPRSLTIVGGGVIACELASFFAAIGVETHVRVRGGRLLAHEDETIEAVFQTEFAREVDVRCQSVLKDLSRGPAGFRLEFDSPGGPEVLETEKVLFAIGRVPNTESLYLAQTDLAADEKGFLAVNENLETVVPGIFATGDVNGRHMLQHAAAAEVFYLRRKFLQGLEGPIDETPLGHAIFAHPEIAAVGRTERQLRDEGVAFVSITEDWLASARVDAMRIDYPRTKLLVSPGTHAILGCHLVGPEASTLIHQVITVMKLKNDVRELAETIHVHPAINECLLAAAVKAVGEIRERAGNGG